MSTYLTTGFVLRQQPWREHDRLYTVLTERHGRLELIGAGTAKLNSKLSPHLQPFAEVELMVAHGKQLDRLAGARLSATYLRPPFSLPQITVGAALLEVTRAYTSEDGNEAALIQLLRRCLIQVANLPQVDWRPAARSLLASFMAEVLTASGLGLPLSSCESCRVCLSGEVCFSWKRHGFLHAPHVQRGEAVVAVAPEVVSWLTSNAAGVVHSAPSGALAFLTDYAQAQAGRELSSLRVLRATM